MKISEKLSQRLVEKYGSWAMITGASSGIGKELAYAVAQAGLNVILVARSDDALQQIAKEITEKHQVKTEVFVYDLGKKDIQPVKEFAKNKEIGLLIASAGFGTSGNFIENTIEEEDNMLQVNCSALLKLTHYFARQFAKNKKGGIILLSSIVSFQGNPFAANYSATKAYVQNLAEGLYYELKPFGVDVLSVTPGPVATGFGKRSKMNMFTAASPEDLPIPILRSLGKKVSVSPGFLGWIMNVSLRLFPRIIRVHIMKIAMKKMVD